MEEAEFHRSLTAGGNSHTQQILFCGGPALTDSSRVPWMAACVLRQSFGRRIFWPRKIRLASLMTSRSASKIALYLLAAP